MLPLVIGYYCLCKANSGFIVHMSRCIRKNNNLHMRNQSQQSRRSAVQLLHSLSEPLFSLHRLYRLSSSLIQNFKLLACLCDCTGQFVSDLVGNQNCCSSHANAHMSCHVKQLGRSTPPSVLPASLTDY